MSNQLYYASEYKVKWEGGFFNYKEPDFSALTDEYFSDFLSYYDVEKCEGELHKSDIQNFINDLKELDPDDMNEFFEDLLNKDVLIVFEDMLAKSDKDLDYVKVTWF